MNSLEPTYFIKHPDGSYSEAEPQPKRYFYENIKVSYLINHLTSAGIHAQRASEISSVEAVDFYIQSVNALRQQQAEIEVLKAKTLTDEETFKQGFIAGFAISAEGWNAGFPFYYGEDGSEDFRKDEYFLNKLQEALRKANEK